ncbi:MAG: hypothetical protein HW388_21 [Dehalococcoidia bacterium]|nr:hypothetical protein [Dehalococcoidia bacterium]
MAEDTTQTVELEPAETLEEGSAEAAKASLEERIAGLEATLAERDARIREMEATLGQAEDALKERESELETVGAQLAQAVALYRASLLSAEPEIPQELVQGTTVEEVETSLALARQMVEQVRSRLEAQASQERVPFGAPVRSAPDSSALSPQEKILLGLSRR